MYAGDGSSEYKESFFQLEKSTCQYFPNQTINFYVDPVKGHDDFLMSLALLVEAADSFEPRVAIGR